MPLQHSAARLRILMLAPFAVHPKGTTRWRVLPLARALAAAGHEVRVVVPPYDWPLHSGRRWRVDGVEVINLRLPAYLAGLASGPPVSSPSSPPPNNRSGQGAGARLAAGVLGHLLVVAGLLRSALSWRPDVVHGFKPVSYSGLTALLLACRPLGPAVVVDADDWEGGWVGEWRQGQGWRLLVDRWERLALRRAPVVTAASHWLCKRAALLRREREGVLYLPNGAEPAQIGQEPRLGTRAGEPRILLYTRFVEHSAEEVWAIWWRVLQAEPAARLLVAGRGLQGEEFKLQALADRGDAASSLCLLGWVPAASRPGLFAAADVAMLPVADRPLNRAKSPMRLVDLLAAGVAVATQNVGEYAVYVSHGTTGLVTPAGDADALAEAVVRLLRDGDLRVRLGAAAARRMRAHYTWPRLRSVALRAYEMALDRGRVHRRIIGA